MGSKDKKRFSYTKISKEIRILLSILSLDQNIQVFSKIERINTQKKCLAILPIKLIYIIL